MTYSSIGSSMGPIDEFVKAFIYDRGEYEKIAAQLGDEVCTLCDKAVKAHGYLWQCRVKEANSLEKKLRTRADKYEDEQENVNDIKDLVGGRIILAGQRDFKAVEESIEQHFEIKDRSQHPKLGLDRNERFRGYDGLHFHVTWPKLSSGRHNDLKIEIQIMSGFMWNFATLDHDVAYKSDNQPNDLLKSRLDMLKGIVQLGELGISQFEEHFQPGFQELHSEHHEVTHESRNAMLELADSIAGKVTQFTQDDKQCLQDLRLTDPRHDMKRIEASKDRLLEGSCSWVFEDSAFEQWWTEDDSDFLWIHGDPGKGKTMMMMAIISELHKRLEVMPGPNVLAYFFCQNANVDLNSTISLLRGLIFLLIDQEKGLIQHLRRRYDTAGKRMFEDENAQYALLAVLKDILEDERLGNVYLMADALDECDPHICDFLEWISHDLGELSNVKWLMTSRNERTLIEIIGNGRRPHTDLELNSLHVSQAVTKFVNYKVNELAQQKNYNSELQGFTKEYLWEHAEGTFLWAALVCEELCKVDAWKVKRTLNKFPKGLDPLYARILDQVIDQDDQEAANLCRQILCTVASIFRPLNLDEIPILADLPEECHEIQAVEDLLSHCGSFLVIRQQMVYLVHQSAKEYLILEKGKTIFKEGQAHVHAEIASLCLRLMSKSLKRNICQLDTLGPVNMEAVAVDAYIPHHIQYACQFWEDHSSLGTSPDHDGPDDSLRVLHCNQILAFFRQHFLHWLEALSCMGWEFRAREALDNLVVAVGVCVSELRLKSSTNLAVEQVELHTDLVFFIRDAILFLRDFRSIIAEAPLQVYNSALVFSREKSIIKQQFLDESPACIEQSSSIDIPPNTAAVTFSPGGQLVAFGCWDTTIRLWDTNTFASQGTLEGHSGAVLAIAFSPDSRLLASGSRDCTVILWDLVTKTRKAILEAHVGSISRVVFSPDGLLMASASWDNTIELWDTNTFASQGTLEGHSDSAIAFSPDSRLLASGSFNGTVRLWDTVTKITRSILRDYPGFVSKVAFSSDCRLLASVRGTKMICVWDLDHGQVIQWIETTVNSLHRWSLYSSSAHFESLGNGCLYLIVDARAYKIRSPHRTTEPVHASSRSLFSLDMSGDWILYDDQEVLWLPQSESWSGFVLQDNMIVTETPDVGLHFIRFSKIHKPPISLSQ